MNKRLKKSDLLSVYRWARGELGYRGAPATMTVGDAIKTAAWDTCGGTMTVHIHIHHPGNTDLVMNGAPVYYGNGRPYVVVDD